MSDQPINRPSKRSIPLSLLSTNTNISQTSKDSTKFTSKSTTKIHDILQTSFKRHKTVQDSSKGKKISSLTKLTDSNLDTNLKNSKPKFKIFQDVRISSDLTNKTTKNSDTTTKITSIIPTLTSHTESLSKDDVNTVPLSIDVINLNQYEQESLMYKFQQPLLKLNNWYKINQFEIFDKDQSYDKGVIVRICQIDKINESISLVTVKKNDEMINDDNEKVNNTDNDDNDEDKEFKVMLLNYKQNFNNHIKFINLAQNDKIVLIEGMHLFDDYKLYHNWKIV